MRIALLAVLAVGACWRAPPATTVAPPTPSPVDARPANAIAPEARARKLIEAQIAIASDNATPYEERTRAVRETFAPDAVIAGALASDLGAQIFDKIAIAVLDAGGTDDVVWFAATFDDVAPEMYRNPTSPASWIPARYTGVIARSAGWKVVAAAIELAPFSGTGWAGANGEPNGTAATGLTRLVLDGHALARAMPASAVVVRGESGTVAGRGPEALGPWADRVLELLPASREIITPSWATVQAYAKRADSKDSAELFVLALPRQAGVFTPIFIQYVGW